MDAEEASSWESEESFFGFVFGDWELLSNASFELFAAISLDGRESEREGEFFGEGLVGEPIDFGANKFFPGLVDEAGPQMAIGSDARGDGVGFDIESALDIGLDGVDGDDGASFLRFEDAAFPSV